MRADCLDHVLILSRQHLDTVLGEYVEHYNTARPHRSIGFHTPSDVHCGRAVAKQAVRAEVLRAAYAAHPERLVRKVPVPPALLGTARINRPQGKEVPTP